MRPLLVLLALTTPALAAEAPAPGSLCGALATAAAKKGLPAPFFTRLIWQESRFDPGARSPAGAQGVAQFMPATASDRGLRDPFDVTSALDASASYLSDLRAQFGNLGLAAAAYNAGPGRVGAWIAGTASLPAETIAYVEIVTGHSVFAWHSPGAAPVLDPEPGFSCVAFTQGAGRRPAPAGDAEAGGPPPKAWAVILVGGFRKEAVLAEYAIVRANLAKVLGPTPAPSVRQRHLGGEPAKKYVVQIEQDDRPSSDRLCKRLERAGGNCVVLRNVLR